MVYIKKILVTTDMSEFSLAALEYASSFGHLFSSAIHLLYVVEPGAPKFSHHGHEGQHRDPRPRSKEEARGILDEFVTKNVNPDIKLAPTVRTGNPADEIRRFAEQEGVDLIVMATHGRTGLRHVVLGSVAEKVVRLSSIPVLTVKPPPMRENILQDEDVEKELHLR
jgi:nucleotide-binding universal stress UspA family protein